MHEIPTLLGSRRSEVLLYRAERLFPEFDIICNTSVKYTIHHVQTKLPFQVFLD